MKILYLANVRLPTEKAHGVQIMKMCEAYARLGHEVELVVPTRYTPISEDPFEYYNVEHNFTITRISTPDIAGGNRFGFLFAACIFGLRARHHIRRAVPNLLYSRDELPLLIASTLDVPYLVWESHTGAWNLVARRLAARVTMLVVISQGLKDLYVARGISSKKIVVAHDAVDLTDFTQVESRDQARIRLGLPKEKRIVLYIGRLDGWKGITTLLEASTVLPHDVLVVVIGGTFDQIQAFSEHYPGVRFIEYRPYRELPNNLAAADVCVLPNTGTQKVSISYTSPLKLFAYMASNRPVVASDLPSIREVLDEKKAVLVSPDNASALASGIQQLLDNPALSAQLADQAKKTVTEYTWEKRAKKILAMISR